MSCPSVEELLAGGGVEHAAGCTGCQAILALAATHAAPLACARAEAFMALRGAGSLAPEAETVLLRHLETCAACLGLARELDSPVVTDALAAAAETEADFTELRIVAADNYVRGAEIGRGGMGHIVRARDRRLGRAVAIKELIDERLRARFEHEARLTAKLQHPAIVSVYEAGRWPSGEPFYAMKYVAGRPLDQVVAGLPTLDQRIGLLPNLITVVEAIAYAHSERVVHRDLKPQNILIGAFGEIVVIDWGLAKDLATPPEAGAPYRDDGGVLTHAGAGTPAYMAPEQARGEAPDERVDVYALGATLHHVLAGDRPDVRPLPAETPRDLRAIVAKAMAPDKQDRYPTATELAGELKRFQDGQLVLAHRYTAGELVRRWLRRHRRIVATAAGFAGIRAVTAAVSVRRIVVERDRADSQRLGAEHLVDYMLGTLRDRLEPLGRLDVLAGVGNEVEHYYASVSTDRDTDPEVLRRRATALDMLGKIDREKGSYDDVHREAARSVELCERLDQVSPSSWAAGCVVHALMRRGNVDTDRGAVEAALGWYRRAGTRLDAALARHPGDADLLWTRAAIDRWVGREYTELGDYERGRVAYVRGIQVLEELVAANPKHAQRLRNLVLFLRDLGDLEANDGHPDAALARYGAAAEAFERLRAVSPDNANMEVEWAQVFASAGIAAVRLGDFALARERVEPALVVLRRHVATDPENHTWQAWLASVAEWACQSAMAEGHLDDAARVCLESAETVERLMQKNAEDERPATILASVEQRLGNLYRERHELAAANRAADKAVEIATAWARKRPGDQEWLLALSDAYFSQASAEREAGSGVTARAAALAAYGVLVGLAPRKPDPDVELSLARAQTLIAELDVDGGNEGAGEADFRRVEERLERAAARWPRVAEIQTRLALTLVRLAEIDERHPGGGEEGRALGRKALSLLEPMEARGAVAYEFRDLPGRARVAAGPRHGALR